MKKVLLALAFICFAGLGFFAWNTQAAQLDLSLDSSEDSDGSELFDDDFNTGVDFEGGTTLTFKASEPISSLYIKWDAVPTATTLKDGDKEVTVGQNGFVHEFVPLSGSNSEATLTIPDGGIKIADVYAFSGDDLPDFVQKWNEPWDKADILFISTHSDDEVLFFGGMIPIYTNEHRARVQVAYFTDFFLTETYRVHEFLDGLWTMGVDHYPQFGKFYDNYSESLEEAEEQFDHDECLSFIVEVIRKFKPQVVVTHDIEGEYGHGGHRYVSKLVREAVEITGDDTKESESAQKYGAWDVPKTYLHLYAENPIETDTRAPLSDFGGKCALDVAKEAYKKHLSQQWMWFYVDDGYDENGEKNDYQYSCAKYGLYRTTVGDDTGTNDVMENLVPYDVQEKQKEEESKAQEESTDTESVSVPDAQTQKHGPSTVLVVILIILVLLVIAFFIILGVAKSRQKKREELARRRREQRALEQRRTAQGGGQRPASGRPPVRGGAQGSSTPQRRRPDGAGPNNRNGNGRRR